MKTALRRARRELLYKLLDKYERSTAYGHPGPWKRDIIVRLDGHEFPDAFAPDGREALLALSLAARELQQAAAVRLVYFKGLTDERPREIRMGPGEVEQAYSMAQSEGFEPLGDALQAVSAQADTLHAADLPEWMTGFLKRVAVDVRSANLAVLSMTRERFKSEWRDLLSALAAAVALARGHSGWERVVSERIFGDSKRLGSIRSKVAELLARADPRWDGLEREDSLDILEAHGVRRKPGLLRCAGTAELQIGGKTYLLQDFTPTAHLPEEWTEAWVKAVAAAAPTWITTIENEFPFLSYVLEAGGPLGLGARSEVVVYTAGFPSSALVQGLFELGHRAPAVQFRHWGDADLGGLRIWWFLRSRMNRPIDLFRTRAEWFEAAVSESAQTLNPFEKRGLERLRREFRASIAAGQGADVAVALSLVEALLRLGKKVEQERY